MLVLASTGMLHGGTSLEIFKEWVTDAKNCVLIPGYCVKGTLGNKILRRDNTIKIGNKNYQVNIEVSKMSFSAHADNRGILNLINHLNP